MDELTAPEPIALSVVLPSTPRVQSIETCYGHRKYRVSGKIDGYDDIDLLVMCDWSPQIGGHVYRGVDAALVIVYTD